MNGSSHWSIRNQVCKDKCGNHSGKTKVENEGRLQTALLEKESQIISSTMLIFQDEIKRLGARIDSLNTIILEKYSATELSQTQKRNMTSSKGLSSTTKNSLTIFCITLWRKQKFNYLASNNRTQIIRTVYPPQRRLAPLRIRISTIHPLRQS